MILSFIIYVLGTVSPIGNRELRQPVNDTNSIGNRVPDRTDSDSQKNKQNNNKQN